MRTFSAVQQATHTVRPYRAAIWESDLAALFSGFESRRHGAAKPEKLVSVSSRRPAGTIAPRKAKAACRASLAKASRTCSAAFSRRMPIGEPSEHVGMRCRNKPRACATREMVRLQIPLSLRARALWPTDPGELAGDQLLSRA